MKLKDIVEISDSRRLISHHVYRSARKQLVADYPELDIGGGIGLCAFASAKLKDMLANVVDLEVIIGRRMVNASHTDHMWDTALHQWKLIPEGDVRYETAKYFLSHNNNKKKKDIGHAVCYDGHTCIDVTSGQFGIPMFYSLDYFTNMWTIIKRDVNIKIHDISDFG